MTPRLHCFLLAAAAAGALALAGCADSPGYYSVRAGTTLPYHGYYDPDLYPYYGDGYYLDRTGYVYPSRYHRVYTERGVRYRVPAHRYDRPRYRAPARVHRRAPARQWRGSPGDRRPMRAAPPRPRVRDHRR